MNEFKRPVHFDLKEFLLGESKKTFLVGAGCSKDPPSNLPIAQEMREAIIQVMCADSEIANLTSIISQLRFEALVELIQNLYDFDLKLIDYFGHCDKPNLQHFFLANMIKQGHFVMTTNFDFLIEYALLELGLPQNEIVVVITKQDFENNSNPSALFRQGFKTLYKIHGSTQNLITQENTRNSLITTIRALGANKKGLDIFHVEPFKRALFNNISPNRSLIVMGYSGSDDFDIIPTLKTLKRVRNLVWTNHNPELDYDPSVYEILNADNSVSTGLDKVDSILVDIKNREVAKNIYRVDYNATKFYEQILRKEFNVSLENSTIAPIVWLKNTLNRPPEYIRYQISFKLYLNLGFYDDALRCAQKCYDIGKTLGNTHLKIDSLNQIGQVNIKQANYFKAILHFKKGLKLLENINWERIKGNIKKRKQSTLGMWVRILANLGDAYHWLGNYLKSLKYYKEAVQIGEKMNPISTHLSGIFIRMGFLYSHQEETTNAVESYEKAIYFADQIGDLHSKTAGYMHKGLIHLQKGNLDQAKELFEKSFEIAKQLKDYGGIASCLINIGGVYLKQLNYSSAKVNFERALEIIDKTGNLSQKPSLLANIGLSYFHLEKYKTALNFMEQSYHLFTKLNMRNTWEAKSVKKNIGLIKMAIDLG